MIELNIDQNFLIAIVTAIVSVTGIILTHLANRTRERLEERRIHHEENRWMLDLINKIEIMLFEKRFATYPELFSVIERLSGCSLGRLRPERVSDIAEQLQAYCYGEVSLYMLADTREALIDLRNLCLQVSAGQARVEDLRLGPRTRLLELMRRDMSYRSKYHGRAFEDIVQSRMARDDIGGSAKPK